MTDLGVRAPHYVSITNTKGVMAILVILWGILAAILDIDENVLIQVNQ